jgi:hypothetical protein
MIIHVEDGFGLARLETGLDFRRTGQNDLEAAIDVVKKGGWHAFVVAPWREIIGTELPTSKPIHVSGFYGAENAALKTFDISVDKAALLEMFCKARSIG